MNAGETEVDGVRWKVKVDFWLVEYTQIRQILHHDRQKGSLMRAFPLSAIT